MAKTKPKEDQDDKVTVENFSSQDMKISCTQPEGFFVKVAMKAKVNLSPHRIYDILVDPDNHKIFKTIQAPVLRKVLQDKGHKQIVLVEQKAGWRFLVFKGSFTTRLKVHQDKRAGTIRFELVRSDLMKDFEGMWTIQPFNQTSLDDLINGTKPRFGLKRFISDIQSTLSGGPKSSLVCLEQSVQPKSVPPGPLAKMLRRIAAKQISFIMQDLKAEVERINTEEAEAKQRNDHQVVNMQQKPAAAAAVMSLSLWSMGTTFYC
eukprot:TRINITY_DN11930_c1_g1_i2.p1 TRINITY_DN11930_c1_g1~~TRINITY_DN11930_c1_g1_i2.p1  ORF type:complete len:307 (-),score=22.67 TRINITY_DN11930_c1_g1_i2:212-997(-)